MKTPAHTNPRYVAARVRALLVANGWTIHTVTGRYSTFGATYQSAPEGFAVHKVGCSKKVSIDYLGALVRGRSTDVPKEVRRARKEEAFVYLRSLGYRVDLKGYIECD